MDIRAVLILAAEGLFALWLLRRDGLIPTWRSALAAAALLALAFVLRGAALNYETLDYQDFLTQWVDFFRDNGGFKALAKPVGNYNIPYLYFLALFSYSDIRDLYLIKLLSIFFDVLLARAAMLLAGLGTDSRVRRLGCFFAVLLLPTVLLNGSVWGQCDSLYAAPLLMGVYYAMKGRPRLSMVCAAVAFGFKLQAVFVLPIYAALWFRGDIKLRHFLIFPLSYVLLVLPAVLLGRPFVETLTLYLNQTGSIGDGLNYNSPSVYAFFWRAQETPAAANAGIVAAFALMFSLLTAAFILRRRLTDKSMLALALLFAIGIPFLLPHMHDRYFFASDVLSVVLAFVCPPLTAVALLAQFASLLGYHAYLKMRYLLTMDKGAIALILAFIITLVFFVSSLEAKKAEPGGGAPQRDKLLS